MRALLASFVLFSSVVFTAEPVAPVPKRIFDPTQIKKSDRLAFTVEALLWQAHEGGLSYTTESKSTTRVKDGHVKNPHFEWSWGFRVGMDYRIPHDEWDLYLNYTQFSTNAHGKAHAEEGGGLFPSWVMASSPTPANGFFATEADAHWRLHLNLLDLELGRNCLATRYLTIRPFFGLRSAWIYQKYEVDYRGGTVVPANDELEAMMLNKFYGIGIRAGLNTLWGLGKGFSIYGNGGGSLLSGFFDVHERQVFERAGSTILSVSNHPRVGVATAEVALGLQYDRLFAHGRTHFGVKLGWELNAFFNQNRLMRFTNASSPGSFRTEHEDLTLNGATLGFRFDF